MGKTAERRKFKRVEFQSKIQYKDFYNPLKVYRTATCLNMGMAGGCFETFENVRLDKILTILVNIPMAYSYQVVPAKIFAKVIYSRKQEGKQYRIGVHFIAIDRKGIIAIGQMVDRALRGATKTATTQKKLEKTAA